jgi:hypothetical protein
MLRIEPVFVRLGRAKFTPFTDAETALVTASVVTVTFTY